MPTYEFRCPLGHEFEKFYRSIGTSEAQAACPICGQIGERFMSTGAGLVFKGSGFYLTDYGKNAHQKKDPAASKGESGKSEGGSSENAKSESSKADSGSSSGSSSSSESSSGSSGESSKGDSKKSETKKAEAKAEKPASAPPKSSSGE